MNNNENKKTIVLAAGGTGGHIFPALSVGLAIREKCPGISLVWIGTCRSREVELCRKHNIPIMVLDVMGINRGMSLRSVVAGVFFLRAILSVMRQFRKHRPLAVIAFGGYVCAPVLAAAVLKKVPFYMHEQNTIAGKVNRLFSGRAKTLFLGFPLAGTRNVEGKSEVTGTPIRCAEKSYDAFEYPNSIDRSKKTILVSGGSQGAQSMNDRIVQTVNDLAQSGLQVIWQTGEPSYDAIKKACAGEPNVHVFATLPDLYPYYALSRLVVGRAGASTLAEVAYFGLPCVLIPLPWAAENHQWVNAGLVESQGWGVRVAQDDSCGANVNSAVERILSNEKSYHAMCMKALDNSPDGAAQKIVNVIMKDLEI